MHIVPAMREGEGRMFEERGVGRVGGNKDEGERSGKFKIGNAG